MALDVIFLRLLSDIETIKLQLSGQLLLSLEDNQRDLKGTEGTDESSKHTHKNVDGLMWGKSRANTTYLETVVADDTKERDDGVDHGEESQGWLHVACALFQEVVQGTLFIIVFSSLI